MIDFKFRQKRAKTQRANLEDSREQRFKGWTMGKAVQAYLPNRLVVLVLREQVLNDKVKDYTLPDNYRDKREQSYGMNRGVERK